MMFRDGLCPFCGGSGAGGSVVGGTLLFFFGLLVLAGVVLLIIWVVRETGSRHAGTGYVGQRGPYPPPVPPPSVPPERPGAVTEDRASGIARERYARGEISREELDEILSNLRRS